MEEMSSVDKFKLPYSLFLDPITDRAAAYTQNHRLITEEASARLVQWGKDRAVRDVPWERELQDSNGVWRPLPAWATDEVIERARLVWVREGSTSDEVLRTLPHR